MANAPDTKPFNGQSFDRDVVKDTFGEAIEVKKQLLLNGYLVRVFPHNIDTKDGGRKRQYAVYKRRRSAPVDMREFDKFIPSI